MPGRVIALLGAESTGKTTLAIEIGRALAADGRRVEIVPETLREFCDREGRTPRRDEQAAIAAEQSRRITEAARLCELVLADTTALMSAVYSEIVFADRSLYAQALADQRQCHLTLLTALDLPWQPDGLQRDGPQVRAPVDALVRAALQGAGLPYAVVGGVGPARLGQALQAVRHALGEPLPEARGPRWVWVCERCGDPDCERHLLAGNI